MVNREQIIFIDKDEISLFLTENALSSCYHNKPIQYFNNLEKSFDYMKGLESSDIDCVSVFIDSEFLMFNKGFIKLAKSVLNSFITRFFLLNTSLQLTKLEKHYINEIDFVCIVEKPINEQKFRKCLDNSLEVA